MKYFVLLIFSFIITSLPAHAQQQMKIMSYNLLNYPGTDTAVRNPYFRNIMNTVNPDILVVCEITSQAGVNGFLNKVMNSASVTYGAGTFIDGPDTDNAIFFKTSKFIFISNTPITTNVRNISEFKIVDKIYKDTLRIFTVHLKANTVDSLERAAEIDTLRRLTNALPDGTNFIVAGDFNIYSSNESAYKKLLKNNPADDGNFLDPLIMNGIWNNSSYAPYHTQSTRVRSFGNGSTGGMDDRFDMILYSNAVKNSGGIKFIPGTYTAYGNDGNHYNDSINKSPNSAVSQAIADALHYASDHLPVFATFEFGNATNLNVNVIPEGMYNTVMNKLNRIDTLKMYLRNSFSPFTVADSAVCVIDSVSFVAPAIFRTAQSGSYYVCVRTINTIETWSKNPVQYLIENVMNYDFTVSDTTAFGNNEILSGAKYCIYSGDVNNDGYVNLADLVLTFNEANTFAVGYLVSDMNGDRIVDLNDLVIVFNNASGFVSKVTP